MVKKNFGVMVEQGLEAENCSIVLGHKPVSVPLLAHHKTYMLHHGM
jgi:hypothetical protein